MSLLLTLRTRTREAHERLEEQLDVLHRCQDRAAYAQLLAGFRSVYAPLEQALEESPATVLALPDWQARRKTAWLDEDLAALGTPPHADVEGLTLPTTEDVVGAAYVMEGATLGGAVVLKQLPPELPHRFFSSYVAERGRMWRAFRSRVEQLEGLDEEAVVASADRTFRAFERACVEVQP